MPEKRQDPADSGPGVGSGATTGKVLIITGMHRSGTSLLTSVLQRSGLDVGDRLLGPNTGNPYGHFEDLDFFDFHEASLRRSKTGVLLQNFSALSPQTVEEEETARELIRARGTLPLWGWKDPRTCLFLGFWSRLLPEASYILVYRHPIDVALSLLRRGIDTEVLAEPLAALRAWCVYNRLILEHYRNHRDRSFLCNIYSVVGDFGGALGLINSKLSLELSQQGGEALYHPADLRRIDVSRKISKVLRQIDPETSELYDELESEADLSAGAPVAAEDSMSPEFSLLEGLVVQTAHNESLRGIWRGPLFSFLLALLDPDATSKQALAVPQLQSARGALVDLRVHMGNLEELSRQDRVRVREVSAHAANLEALVREREDEVEGLRAHARNLESQNATDQGRIRELTSHAENLEVRVAEQTATVEQLTSDLGHLENRREAEQTALRGLEETTQQQARCLSQQAREMATLAADVALLERQRLTNKATFQELVTQVEELEAEAESLKRQRATDQDSIRRLRERSDVQEKQMSRREQELKQQLAERGQELEALAARSAKIELLKDDLQTQSEDRNRKLAETRNWLRDCQAQAQGLVAARAAQDGQLEELSARVEELQRDLGVARSLAQNAEASLRETEALRTELVQQVSEHEAKVEELSSASAAQREELHKQQLQLKGAHNELERLRSSPGVRILHRLRLLEY